MLNTTKTEAGAETTVLTRTTYDVTKKIVQLILPAIASLYFGMSQIWGLPAGEEVVGSIALLTTFLGTVLGVSSSRYHNSAAAHDGQMIVTQDPGGIKNFLLNLDSDPETLVDKEAVSFKVKTNRMPMPPTT